MEYYSDEYYLYLQHTRCNKNMASKISQVKHLRLKCEKKTVIHFYKNYSLMPKFITFQFLQSVWREMNLKFQMENPIFY